MDEFLFGPEHYGYLVHHGLVPMPHTLGVIVDALPGSDEDDMSEFEAGLCDDMIQWGVLSSPATFTPEATALFTGIHTYDHCIWGITYLHNEKQPYTVELSEELLAWGLQYALTDTPKVFWQISLAFGLVYIVVRAGETISISAYPQGNTPTDTALAEVLLRIMDPEQQWQARSGSQMRFPAEQFLAHEVNFTDETEGKRAASKLKAAMLELNVPAKWVDEYVELQRQERAASVSVNYSPNTSRVSNSSLQLSYIVDRGVQVAFSSKSVDQIHRVNLYPATVDAVAQGIHEIRRSGDHSLPH